MTWQTIESYPCEDYECGPQVLLYDPAIGIRIGSGSRYHWEDEVNDFAEFTYDYEGWEINPTHWSPLPEPPKELP